MNKLVSSLHMTDQLTYSFDSDDFIKTLQYYNNAVNFASQTLVTGFNNISTVFRHLPFIPRIDGRIRGHYVLTHIFNRTTFALFNAWMATGRATIVADINAMLTAYIGLNLAPATNTTAAQTTTICRAAVSAQGRAMTALA
jgi:hypothetical protein